MENKYEFFWKSNSPFSNWHPAKFEVDGQKFENSEQYMMWAKATLMADFTTADKIMKISDPHEIKKLGKQVTPFNSTLWDKVKFDVMTVGCKAKFTQNEVLKKVLLATGDKKICEASPFDRIWGIGLNEDDAKKTDSKDWPGQNLLGKVLTKLRDELKNS